MSARYDTTGRSPGTVHHRLSDGRRIRTGHAMRHLLVLSGDEPVIARKLARRVGASQSLGYEVIKRTARAGLVAYVPFVGVTIPALGREVLRDMGWSLRSQR